MKVTTVIPTYNERKNIRKLIPQIFDVFNAQRIRGEIIVVDDGSPDGTAMEIKRMQKKYPIVLIERDKKTSLGSAYLAGFKRALDDGADLILGMDADLSHDPTQIPEFIEKIKEGHDVVIGSRLMDGGEIVGWGPWRRMVSFGGNLVGRYVAGVYVSDLTSGYRAYKADVLKNVDLDKIASRGYDFQLEMLWRSVDGGYRVATIPIVFEDRKIGKSKLSKMDILRFFLTAMKIRLNLI